MTIDIDALKRDKRPQSSAIVHALLDRLEAAEADALEQARLNGMGREREAALKAKLEVAEKERVLTMKLADRLALALNTSNHERDAMRARIEAMEKQEPVGTAHTMPGASAFTMACFDVQDIPVGTQLYALPGAQGEEK